MSGSRAASDELILSIDAGTQSIRAALVGLDGTFVGFVKTPIEPYFAAQPGRAEQHPEYYWQMLCETTQALLARENANRQRIVAVTVTTQRLTMVNLDRAGEPLRPAIVWLDRRKAGIREVIPRAAIPLLKASGRYPVVSYAAQYSRSNWLRQNEPDLWARTHKFVFLSGYFTFRLTGEHRDSTGSIVGPVPFDVKRAEWAGRYDLKWRLFPIEREKLPELVLPTEELGRVTAGASAATAIPIGLPVIAASNDKACDIIGTGCLTPDQGCISFGTTATFNTQTPHYVEVRPGLPPYPSAVAGHYYTEVAVLRGMWLVSWFRDQFGHPERLAADATGQVPEELLEHLLRNTPPGSAGLLCLPHWTPGPQHDPFAKGAVIGFGETHTRGHLYRAMLEGIVFALKEGAQLTQRKTRVPIAEIRATGGGSSSRSLMQMTADIFDLPTSRPHTSETSVIGAAMTAAAGMGVFPDVAAAAGAMTRPGEAFEPDPVSRDLYRDLFDHVYRGAYGRLRPLYREIQRISGSASPLP